MHAKNLETLELRYMHLEELNMHAEKFKLKTLTLFSSKLRTLDIWWVWHLDELNIRYDNDLVALNLMRTQNLKVLKLFECKDMLELHMPIESLELETIEVGCCSELRTLNLTGTWNLERLDLEQCESLLELCMPVNSLELVTIRVRRCSMLSALNLTGTRNLRRLDLEQCEGLLELHMPIESPELKTIEVWRCSKLRTLNLMKTWNLKRLDLEQCEDLLKLHMPIEIPELETIEVRCCSKLRTYLKKCEDLAELYMPDESPKLKTIEIGCSKLRTLKVGLSPHLEWLDLDDCSNLLEINAPVGYFSGRVRFKPILVNEGFPTIDFLPEVHLKVMSFLGICPLHPHNNLPKFHFECIYTDLLLSSTTQNLRKLITFDLCACKNLARLSTSICGLQGNIKNVTLEGCISEVPMQIEQLKCLEELTLLSTRIKNLPDSIYTLKHLKFLWIKSCWLLEQLPEDLNRLECLEKLHLSDCKSLRNIPNSICEMKRLNCFELINCILIENLPRDLGRLQCLEYVYIQGTSIVDPPESIFQIKNLLFYP